MFGNAMSWEYDTFKRSILPNCAEINVDTFTEFVHYHYFFLLQWLRAAIVQLKGVALKCETVGWMLHCLMCLPYSLIIKQIWHSSSWSLFKTYHNAWMYRKINPLPNFDLHYLTRITSKNGIFMNFSNLEIFYL